MTKFTKTSFATIACVLVLSACGGGDETTITTADGKDVTIKSSGDGEDANISIKGENGETATFNAGASAAGGTLPAGVAAYPGAKSTMTMSGSEGGKKGGVAVLETTDSPDKVIAFYKAEATSKGLTKDVVEANSNSEGEVASTYSAKSGDGTGLVVTAAQKDGKTTITVMGGQE